MRLALPSLANDSRLLGLAASVWNVALNQASWFAVVLGAAWGHPWLGAVLGLVPIGLHVATVADRPAHLRLISETVLVGVVVESVNAALGLYLPHSGGVWVGVAAPWLFVLWAGFAIAFDKSLAWMSGRPWLAMTVGAVAGPVSFWSGSRLGAITLADGMLPAVVLAVEWAIVLPLLAWRADVWLRSNTRAVAVSNELDARPESLPVR